MTNPLSPANISTPVRVLAPNLSFPERVILYLLSVYFFNYVTYTSHINGQLSSLKLTFIANAQLLKRLIYYVFNFSVIFEGYSATKPSNSFIISLIWAVLLDKSETCPQQAIPNKRQPEKIILFQLIYHGSLPNLLEDVRESERGPELGPLRASAAFNIKQMIMIESKTDIILFPIQQ